MEHLPVPDGKAAEMSHTIRFSQDKLYDGGPFLTYPQRDGWPEVLVRALQSSDSLALLRYQKHYLTLYKDLEGFLQRWLFFGLLAELLGNDFRSSDFISDPVLDAEATGEQPGTCRFLTTDKLSPLVISWMQRIQSGQATCTYTHVAACLQVAYRALLATGPDFDANLKVCLASVCEDFGFAANIGFDITNFTVNDQCPAGWISASGLRHWGAKLHGSSWCPYQARMILESTMSVQTIHFMSLLGEQDAIQPHRGCSQDQCVTSQVDLALYETQHYNSKCQCDFAEVDNAVMESILQAGSYPLLHITRDNNFGGLNVKLLASSPEVPFVAVSHVWADGLGNPRANSLPKCQLAALYEWVRQLLGCVSEAEHVEEVFLWCDTMCCPRKPIEARRMAISCMHRVYQEAAYVLVLDKYLKAFPLQTMNADEVYARIVTSNWGKRMWTLQEGALPKSHEQVWFRFLDRCVSMQDLIRHMQRDLYKNPFRHGLSIDMFSYFEDIRSKWTEGVVPAITRMGIAFKNRNVSYTHDEPLLLGMMLDLDVLHILHGPDETRMQRMWSLMPGANGGIPEGIIFRSGRRLGARGFRWAPATFLEGDETLDMMMVPVRLARTGVLIDRGLLVPMSGYKIERAKLPLNSNPWGIEQKEAGPFVLRGEDRCYLMMSTEDNNLSPTSLVQLTIEERNLYVLHPRDKLPPQDDEALGATRALLVELDSEDQGNGTKYVRSLRHVSLGRWPRPECNLHEAAHRCASQLAASDLGRNYIYSTSDSESIDIACAHLFTTEVNRLVMQLDDSVIESARSYPEQDVRATLKTEAAFLFSMGSISIGPRSADSQQWCVD